MLISKIKVFENVLTRKELVGKVFLRPKIINIAYVLDIHIWDGQSSGTIRKVEDKVHGKLILLISRHQVQIRS